jgi:hypothetical protein
VGHSGQGGNSSASSEAQAIGTAQEAVTAVCGIGEAESFSEEPTSRVRKDRNPMTSTASINFKTRRTMAASQIV